MKKGLLRAIVFLLILNTFACEKEIENKITKDEAINAIRNYNYENIEGLEKMVESNEYSIYWDIESEDDNQIVVVFRSYTGAINRYYIDKNTGETYVTEFVPGIILDEQKTDEKFNIKNYMNKK